MARRTLPVVASRGLAAPAERIRSAPTKQFLEPFVAYTGSVCRASNAGGEAFTGASKQHQCHTRHETDTGRRLPALPLGRHLRLRHTRQHTRWCDKVYGDTKLTPSQDGAPVAQGVEREEENEELR